MNDTQLDRLFMACDATHEFDTLTRLAAAAGLIWICPECGDTCEEEEVECLGCGSRRPGENEGAA